MHNICDSAILITGNETDIFNSLGYGEKANPSSKRYLEVAKKIFSRFPKLKYISVSIRQSRSASENTWSGILICKEKGKIEQYISEKYTIQNIVDRVGTGDSFSGGLIHGIINFGNEYQRIVDFAAALSALNHTIRGDASQFNVDEVEHLIATKGSGRIIRWY